MISENQGETWTTLNINKAVVAVAVNPKNEKQITVYSEEQGLIMSSDGGKTWENQGSYAGGIVMHLAYDVQNPSVVYLINQELEIHKTIDAGKTWKKVR